MVRLKYPLVASKFNIKHHTSKTAARASVFPLNVELKHAARFSYCKNLYSLEFGRSCSNSCGSTRFPASSFMPNLENGSLPPGQRIHGKSKSHCHGLRTAWQRPTPKRTESPQRPPTCWSESPALCLNFLT